MKPIRSLAVFIFGIIVGIVLTIGGTAFAGYLIVTKTKMGDIEDKVIDKAIEGFDLPADIRELTMLDYGKNLYEKLRKIGQTPISDIESALGYRVSPIIAEAFGIEESIVSASTFPELPDAIVNGIKVRTLNEKLGVEFPDFPLFKDEAFLDTPVKSAFSTLDDQPFDKFVKIVYDDDPDPAKPRSNKFVQKLGSYKISEISNDMDSILADTKLSEVVTITEESEPILKALKDTYLDSQALNDKIGNLKVKDVFKNYDSGVISLISEDTSIQDVPQTLSTAIAQATLYELTKLGVYNVNFTDASEETKAKMYNNSPNEIVQEYMEISENPASAPDKVRPGFHYVSGSITQDRINGLTGFKKGDILVLTGAAQIPDEEVFTSVFSIDTKGYDLTIGDDVWVDNPGGYMFIRGYTGAGTITSARQIKKTSDLVYDAVLVEILP